MSSSLAKRKRKISVIIISAAVAIAAIVIAAAVYLGDYYHADTEAIEAVAMKSTIEYKTLDNDNIVIEPEEATKGFIFYPGGKVEYTAYIPLMQVCAEQDVLCVLVKMPFNLAVFDMNAADGIREQYPEIEEWYIGGHSLGGSMAASYLSDHSDDYEGLILLGSYSTADLSDTNLNVLSVFGSEDKVLNREKYDDNKVNLPGDFTEKIIDGGCHAYFGVYGEQEGDGTPTISRDEQIQETAVAVCSLIKPHDSVD